MEVNVDHDNDFQNAMEVNVDFQPGFSVRLDSWPPHRTSRFSFIVAISNIFHRIRFRSALAPYRTMQAREFVFRVTRLIVPSAPFSTASVSDLSMSQRRQLRRNARPLVCCQVTTMNPSTITIGLRPE